MGAARAALLSNWIEPANDAQFKEQFFWSPESASSVQPQPSVKGLALLSYLYAQKDASDFQPLIADSHKGLEHLLLEMLKTAAGTEATVIYQPVEDGFEEKPDELNESNFTEHRITAKLIKTERGIKIIAIDSLGDSHYMDSFKNTLEGMVKDKRVSDEVEREYYYAKLPRGENKRQFDFYSCGIFCIKDARLLGRLDNREFEKVRKDEYNFFAISLRENEVVNPDLLLQARSEGIPLLIFRGEPESERIYLYGNSDENNWKEFELDKSQLIELDVNKLKENCELEDMGEMKLVNVSYFPIKESVYRYIESNSFHNPPAKKTDPSYIEKSVLLPAAFIKSVQSLSLYEALIKLDEYKPDTMINSMGRTLAEQLQKHVKVQALKGKEKKINDYNSHFAEKFEKKLHVELLSKGREEIKQELASYDASKVTAQELTLRSNSKNSTPSNDSEFTSPERKKPRFG